MAKTILLVEDNTDSREMLAYYLKAFDYRIIEARNGFEAIEYVRGELPDLILMDMVLPGMDGVETIIHIKKMLNGEEIPVICLTAFLNYYSEKAVEAGCRNVLAKPVDINKLVEIIKQYTA